MARERIPGLRDVAERLVDGEQRFYENVMERGFTKDQAIRIFQTYKRMRVISRASIRSDWVVKHGAFWDRDVLERAPKEGPAKRQRARGRTGKAAR